MGTTTCVKLQRGACAFHCRRWCCINRFPGGHLHPCKKQRTRFAKRSQPSTGAGLPWKCSPSRAATAKPLLKNGCTNFWLLTFAWRAHPEATTVKSGCPYRCSNCNRLTNWHSSRQAFHSQQTQALAEVIQPQFGILTHIGEAHRENFESQRAIADEKCVLFQACEVSFFRLRPDTDGARTRYP